MMLIIDFKSESVSNKQTTTPKAVYSHESKDALLDNRRGCKKSARLEITA